MRKVYDYKDIRKLEKSIISDDIVQGTIITATSDLASAMRAYYPDYNVVDMHKIVELLVPEWEKTSKDLKNYIQLRSSIEDYIFDAGVSDEIATCLRRNSSDMWNAIILLIEADIYPDDIADDDFDLVNQFKEIWYLAEKDNSQMMKFRAAFSYKISKKNYIRERVKKIIRSNNIYLLGFYFITPIQQRLFELMEKDGFSLAYLNCYNHNYEFAHQIWEETFKDEYDEGVVIDIQPDIQVINQFGNAIEVNSNSVSFEVVKYVSDFELAKKLKDYHDRDEAIYSSNAKECNELLLEFYPELDENKHLLSYPVGQYVYCLHMMWNEFENSLELNAEYALKCFASGWLITEQINGKDYTYDIKRMETFFKDCKTFEQWESRIKTLKEAKKVTRCFEPNNHKHERYHKMLGNPYNYIGVYNIEEDKLDDIIKLLQQLMEDAKYLFAGELRTNLFEHLKKVRILLENRMDSDVVLADEQRIAEELISKLNAINGNEIICPMNSIKDAIILLIGDKIGDYESHDSETKGNNHIVKPLAMIESSILSNYGQAIHLVDADEISLPGSVRPLPWPLTTQVINKLIENKSAEKTNYISLMQGIIKNRPLSYRYLFYTFLGNVNEENTPPMTVEWVTEKNNREIGISPYVKLMINKEILEESKSDDESLYENLKKLVDNVNTPQVITNVTFSDQDVPEEVLMDFLSCKQRYLYSYKLNERPVFVSEFHQTFVMSKLITAFSAVSMMSKHLIAENIYELFPFFRTIELHQAVDFAKNKDFHVPYIYDEYEYPKQRLQVHYLDNGLMEDALARQSNYVNNNEINHKRYKSACMYCPYTNICLYKYGGAL